MTAGWCLRPADMLCSQPMSWYAQCHEHTTASVTGVLPPAAHVCWTICHPLCDVNSVMRHSNDNWRHFYMGDESMVLCDSLICSTLEVHLLTYLFSLRRQYDQIQVDLRWIENGWAFNCTLLHQRAVCLGLAGVVCRVVNLVVNILARVHVKARVEEWTVTEGFWQDNRHIITYM